MANLGALFLTFLFIYFAGMHLLYDGLRPLIASGLAYIGVGVTPMIVSACTIGLVVVVAVAAIGLLWKRTVPTYT